MFRPSMLLVVIALLLALVLPYTAQALKAGYQRTSQARAELAVLQSKKMELDQFYAVADDYARDAEVVNRFVAKARAYGLERSMWHSNSVNIEGRRVTFTDLADFLAEAGNTPNYYFNPDHLALSPSGGRGENRGVVMEIGGTYLVNSQR